MDDRLPQETVLTVGECYPEWQTGQDCFRVEWGESGLVLFAMLNGISPLEKEQFAPAKKMTVRYTVIEGVCYFAFRFGEMPWGDCPFHPALYREGENAPVFPELMDYQGFSLTVLLIDTSTGELCAARLIGLGHDFSVKWREWAMQAAEEPFDFAEYSRRVDEAYGSYSGLALAQKGLDEGNEYTV